MHCKKAEARVGLDLVTISGHGPNPQCPDVTQCHKISKYISQPTHHPTFNKKEKCLEADKATSKASTFN